MRRFPVGTVIDNQVSGTAYRIHAFLGREALGPPMVRFTSTRTVTSTATLSA